MQENQHRQQQQQQQQSYQHTCFTSDLALPPHAPNLPSHPSPYSHHASLPNSENIAPSAHHTSQYAHQQQHHGYAAPATAHTDTSPRFPQQTNKGSQPVLQPHAPPFTPHRDTTRNALYPLPHNSAALTTQSHSPRASYATPSPTAAAPQQPQAAAPSPLALSSATPGSHFHQSSPHEVSTPQPGDQMRPSRAISMTPSPLSAWHHSSSSMNAATSAPPARWAMVVHGTFD